VSTKTQSLFQKLLMPAAAVAFAAAFAAPAYAQDAKVTASGGGDIRPVSRVEPEFPLEAVKAGRKGPRQGPDDARWRR
jgi:hypothetical protein